MKMRSTTSEMFLIALALVVPLVWITMRSKKRRKSSFIRGGTQEELELRQLIVECQWGQLQHAELMMHNGIDPLALYHPTNTNALITAIEYNHADITESILSYTTKENCGRNQQEDRKAYKLAFHSCCYNDLPEHAELLLNTFGVIEFDDTDMALDIAATNGAKNMVKFLLLQKENVIKIHDWSTTIICCAREGHADIVELLVNTLEFSQKSDEWATISLQDRFVLYCAAGRKESALCLLLQNPLSDYWSLEWINRGFALGVCCGRGLLALELLDRCASLTTETESCPVIDVSVEDNLATRAASVLNLTCVFDAILSHTEYKPPPVKTSFNMQLLHTKLVDLDMLASYLMQWNIEKRAFPRCQDLPDDVFQNPAEGSSVWFISHRWNSESHPDIHVDSNKVNMQIMTVVKFLKTHREKYCSCYRLRNLCPTHANKAASDDPIGIFYDFLSLPQAPRTVEESRIFKNGLLELDSIATDANFLALSPVHAFDEFLHRGWCFVEVCLAMDFGGDFKYSCFLAEDQPDLLNSAFALQAMQSRRAVKQAHMAHSIHIEEFFQNNNFKCTNQEDFSRVAGLLRTHLKNSEKMNYRRVQCSLFIQRWDMLRNGIERHQNFMSKMSFDQHFHIACIKCAALSRAILCLCPDHENQTCLEAASLLSNDEDSADLVQVYHEQLMQVQDSLQIVHDNVFCPLFTMTGQQTEEAFYATKQRLLIGQSGHDDLCTLALDLNPECALVLLSLQNAHQNLSHDL